MEAERASYAEAAEFCEDIERRRALFPDEDPERVFRYRLARWITRRGSHRQHSPTQLAETQQ